MGNSRGFRFTVVIVAYGLILFILPLALSSLQAAPLAYTTSFVYDARGNPTSTTDPLGKVTSRIYDASGNVLSITDANGSTTSFSYDAYSNPTQTKDPLGNIKNTTYDVAGRKLSETDANGNVTSYAYDANDNLLSITDAIGHVQSFTYDANNNKTSMTDRNGHTTYYAYDEDDNLISTTDAFAGLTSYTYDALDRKNATTDALGNVTSSTIDLVGNVTGMKDAEGRISSFTYDANGNRLSASDPLGNATSYVYDALNRLTSTTDPLGNVQGKAYDFLGRAISETDANGHATQYQYDAMGRLSQVTEAGGQVTSYAYDPVGNKTAFTNARGKTTSYAYDAANRLISETDPDGNLKQYGYDGFGNLTGLHKPDGAVINYSYDTLNRMSGIAYPTGLPTTFRYDAAGNRTGMTDTLGTSSWGFDALNRMAAYSDPFGKVVQYAYDAIGNRTEITYPASFSVIYAYDKTGRMLSVTDWLGNTTGYQYDGAGRLISASNPNGSTTGYSYDVSSRLIGLLNSKADLSIISGYSYTLDGVGNQVAEVRNEPILTTLPTASFASTFDNDDRIKNAGSRTFTHDANGNRTAQTGTNGAVFKYDYANRLTSVSGATIYEYNGLGNRLTRAQAVVGTRYVLDIADILPNVIEETDAVGNAISYYVYGLGLVSKITPDGKIYTYHYDSRGSTIAISDSTGKIVNKYTYTPFGEMAGSSESITNPFCYAGKHGIMEEVNGLKFMRARYYDTETGRFLNKDLIQGSWRSPQELNRYTYVKNNPVIWIDATGLFSWSEAWSDTKQLFASVSEQIGKDIVKNTATSVTWAVKQGATSVPEVEGAIQGTLKETMGGRNVMTSLSKGIGGALAGILVEKTLDKIEGQADYVPHTSWLTLIPFGIGTDIREVLFRTHKAGGDLDCSSPVDAQFCREQQLEMQERGSLSTVFPEIPTTGGSAYQYYKK
jgi:RHS repeat-associated protein